MWYRGWQTFSVKLQIVNVLPFADLTISITAALLLDLEGSRGQSVNKSMEPWSSITIYRNRPGLAGWSLPDPLVLSQYLIKYLINDC